MIEIKIKKLYDDVILPEKKSKEASCYDIYAHSIEKMEDGFYKIGFGFATEIPYGFQGEIFPRSSISQTGWILANSIGVIDSDYRGEWMGFYRAVSFDLKQRTISKKWVPKFKSFPYKVGDRVAQFKVIPVINYSLTASEELNDSERGDGGFGSTGM